MYIRGNGQFFQLTVDSGQLSPQERSKKAFPAGEGGPQQRWMRGGTAFRIVGTTGAEVDIPSLTVGNGLCAVPLRCNYNPWGIKTKPLPDYVIPSERSESRNPPKWQILPCGGTFLPRGGFLHSACAPVGMTKLGYVSTNSPTVSRMFQAVPLPHQSGLRPASFPGGEALVLGFGVQGFSLMVPSFYVRNGT